MYLPSEFKNTNDDLTKLIIKKNPLATLISYHNEIYISHIPTIFAVNKIYGHLSSRNPHAQLLEGSHSVQLLFNSPDSYISPTWYNNPAENVPTWNYCSVLVKAKSFLSKDPKKIQEILKIQISEYEKNNWSLNDLSEEFINILLSEIVVFEFQIESIESKFKISQNRNPQDIDSVIKHLENSNFENELRLSNIMRMFYDKK
jgi:transcriptional regulator